MNLTELYRFAHEPGELGDKARELLGQTHWFASFAEFDPKTGEALPLPLSTLLRRIAAIPEDGTTKDRLWMITEYSRSSVERLLRLLSESPRRESAYLPIRTVRELDTASFIALSRRPGRNIREKLADKPYMQAIRRFQSVNLPENQLLKAFVSRLAELLELRKKYLHDDDILLQRIYKWLNTDEAQVISRWQNLPPNNTLLAHREYRRIWNAWRWLQTLDDDIERDSQQFERRKILKSYWDAYAYKYQSGTMLLGEMPVFFNNQNVEHDYGSFDVRPWVFPMPEREASSCSHPNESGIVTDKPVCIDLSYIRPRFAGDPATRGVLDCNFIWQRWKNDDALVDIDLFEADALYANKDTETLSSYNLFFPGNAMPDLLNIAAHSFALKLNSLFKAGTLIWIAPDCLNDFDLELLRRNLNSRFVDAEPLPCSVAAVIENIQYEDIPKDGYSVAVVQSIYGKTYATEMIARFDKKLLQRLPETCGYIWERGAPGFMSADSPDDLPTNEIYTIGADGQWFDALSDSRGNAESADIVMKDKKKQFDLVAKVNHSPVCGGIKLYQLQQLAGDIPLWRNHIPELSIKVLVTGKGYRPFTLVGKNVTVTPIRGLAVPIPVPEEFTLPAGRPYFSFPLFQGADESALEYEARLESPSFPLKTSLRCRLNMTYTYGADDPYRLVFEPIDDSHPPIVTKWQPKSEIVITNAPGPEYPSPLTWNDLYTWKDAQGQSVNVLQWLTESLGKLIEMCKVQRFSGTINSRWRSRTSANGKTYWFTFISTPNGDRYCNSNDLVYRSSADPNIKYPEGTVVFFGETKPREDGSVKAVDVSERKNIEPSRHQLQRLQNYRERSLQNRMTAIWADARSANDRDCPPEFRVQVGNLLGALMSDLPASIIENKMMVLLSCIHKDAPDACVLWLKKQVSNKVINNPQAVGNALGDLSCEWQKEIFRGLISNPTNSAINVFAYAIWRERKFVDTFSYSELQLILNSIRQRLKNIKPLHITGDEKKDKSNRKQWGRDTTEPLELLLGLLRTRESLNPEIRMLLQPQQPNAVTLAEEIEELIERISSSRVTIYSRVQLDVSSKPSDDKTPDILYALRVYLTGDDSANAIRVTGVSDED